MSPAAPTTAKDGNGSFGSRTYAYPISLNAVTSPVGDRPGVRGLRTESQVPRLARVLLLTYKASPRYQNPAIYVQPAGNPRFDEVFLRLGTGEPNVPCEGCWIPYGLPLDCRVNQYQNYVK